MVSRVAKQPVPIPAGVEVAISGQLIKLKGKLGELSRDIHPLVLIDKQDNEITFAPKGGATEANALAGTMRALVHNDAIGVSQGFERKLILKGIGYRAVMKGKAIDLSLGFSHPVLFQLPESVAAETPSATEIVLKSVDKQLIGQVAANIRAIRPPEPYKGKGIRYADERIILKEGKKK